MASVSPIIPASWQADVIDALKKARETDPTKAVFGVSLPEAWKHELAYYARAGELSRLFGVRAVSFGGKTITVFDAPGKEAQRSQKKAG